MSSKDTEGEWDRKEVVGCRGRLLYCRETRDDPDEDEWVPRH